MIFLLRRFVCFFGGIWKKRVVGCGFLMVKVWWICGETWSVDGHFLGFKNMPRILDLFLAIPILGIFVDLLFWAAARQDDEGTGCHVRQEAMPALGGTGMASSQHGFSSCRLRCSEDWFDSDR